mgnify:CR=1 FL=1
MFKLKRTTSMVNIERDQTKNIEIPEIREPIKEAKLIKTGVKQGATGVTVVKPSLKKHSNENDTQLSTAPTISAAVSLTRSNTVSTMTGNTGSSIGPGIAPKKSTKIAVSPAVNLVKIKCEKYSL